MKTHIPKSVDSIQQKEKRKGASLAPPLLQRKENKTGMPDQLKSGVESLSGIDVSDVKVHYNSSQPVQLNAHAYAQGSQIHIAPGQEKHLPHEVWHVVQQKQGRVRPTKQLKGKVNINDDVGLEKEADIMGPRANLFNSVANSTQMKTIENKNPSGKQLKKKESKADNNPLQLKLIIRSSSKPEYNEMKYTQFQSLRKRFDMSVEAWLVIRKLAKDKITYYFDNWFSAIERAQKVHNLGPKGYGQFKNYIESGSNLERKTIKQPGYATGDQFGIAAAMIIDDNLDVVITSGPKPGQQGHDPTDKAEMIRDFYLESGISPFRINIAPVANIRTDANQQMTGNIKNTYHRDFNKDVTNSQIKNNRSYPVGFGTTSIAENWSIANRDKVKNAWKVNSSKDAEIQTWLNEKGIPLNGKNIAILWSRFSGKKGDIHLEHDTSYMGMRQIVLEAAKHYTAIIIAGDPSATPKNANKYSNIAATFGMNVYNLTGFWQHKTATLKAWGGDTRTGQFKLYDYLHRNFAELKHLGSRSGNLEVMAMLGHTVRYMEEPNSMGSERMEAWHEKDQTGLTNAGGMATGYERLLLERPATREGQYLKANMDQGPRPDWAPGRPGAKPKPAGVNGYIKGYSDNDMAKIRRYLKLPAKESASGEFSNLENLDLSVLPPTTNSSILELIDRIIKDNALPQLKTMKLNQSLRGTLRDRVRLVENRGITVTFQ
jgi:hypothetical protein